MNTCCLLCVIGLLSFSSSAPFSHTLWESLPLSQDVGLPGEYSENFFHKFPIMKIPPKAGEFIAVRVLSLDECYSPVYSNYLPARVIEVNGLMVKLKFVDKIKNKKDDTDNVEEVDLTFEEDEVDLTKDAQDRVESIDWRDIYEPRLLYP
ncbi:hypothetical protein Hamer_G002622 [Homarus americanus]|uniref:Uncharacterized protein n=1 Tax=Homarus americanus TaxID=6706 RepID=A0A8J5K697_HOMAM|nr:hypothetical protein Hamer_G002622 [Homarus americanus]